MTDPTKKPFRLSADQIRPLATEHGGCIATDVITRGGHKVAFMYREATDRDVDSGWRFMSGLESDEYMDDADNHAVYDVNTIANYDPDVIPYLDAPVGSVCSMLSLLRPLRSPRPSNCATVLTVAEVGAE